MFTHLSFIWSCITWAVTHPNGMHIICIHIRLSSYLCWLEVSWCAFQCFLSGNFLLVLQRVPWDKKSIHSQQHVCHDQSHVTAKYSTAVTKAEHNSESVLIKDTLYLIFTGELWVCPLWAFWRKLTYNNGTELNLNPNRMFIKQRSSSSLVLWKAVIAFDTSLMIR